MGNNMPTIVHIHEYGCKTKSYTLSGNNGSGVPQSNGVWDDCVLAISLTGYRSGQHPNETIRAPGAWSAPATNIGNGAAAMAYAPGVLAQPHVHGGRGVGHRAALGCRFTTQNGYYQYLNIYIGEFS
jgi:hypothetical protein